MATVKQSVEIEVVDLASSFRPIRLPWQRPSALEEFVAFPRTGLPHDSSRAALLDVEQADLVDRRSHPFYRDVDGMPGAEAQLFIARRDGVAIGRIAAIVNHQHNAFESKKENRTVRTGFFGFYEAIDEKSVATALLDAAAAWLQERGMDEIIGPASPSHNYYFGSRCRSEEPAPSQVRFLESDNPDYYNRQYEAWGLTQVRRLFGYDCDLASNPVQQTAGRFERTVRESIRATGMVFRRLRLDDFDAEITRANALINRSLEENWGFSPMTRAELAYMGKQMRWLIDPELVLFVEIDGEPVGISLAIPDYNQVFAAMGGRLGGWPAAFRFGNLPLVRYLWPDGVAWSTARIETARVVALGVLPTVWRNQGSMRRELLRLGPALVFETFENVHKAGYRWLTASWILEDNRAMLAPFQLAGLRPSRIWKVYRRALGG